MHFQATSDAIARAKKIKVLLFDVDGVLTDGTIWLVPKAASSESEHTQAIAGVNEPGKAIKSPNFAETKGFSAHDGLGITLARIGGLKIGFVTKRISDVVALRASDLRVEHLYMGQSHKMQAVHDIISKTGVALEEIAFVGDDVVDLPVLKQCGLAIASGNARSVILPYVHWQTPNRGGEGAGRDAIEFILEAQGKLEYAMTEFMDEKSSIAAASDIGSGGM